MNYLLTTLLLALTSSLAFTTWAQPATASMTLDQLKAIRQLPIANLDKDTYVKTGGYILDRYEERPAYVFTYSDGTQRRVYLYRVFTAANATELGLLAIYQNASTTERRAFVIPGATAERAAWDAYLDDLKYIGEKEPGLLPALSFTLARELTTLLNGPATGDRTGQKKEEYNFCFAPTAPVALPDGRVRAIGNVVVGDTVLGVDPSTRALRPTRVLRVDAHTGGRFRLLSVWLLPARELLAGTRHALSPAVGLEATPNHPVLTAAGPKPLGNVVVGDVLYRYEAGDLVPYYVVKTDVAGRYVDAVYNVVTEAGAYTVSDVVVLDK